MFEKLLERVLNSYLDPYVNGIKKDGLSVLRGDLVFENLTLKTEAFAFLKDSGLSLRAGRIGRLRLQIPWRKLSSGKISLELDTLALDVARVDGDIPDEKRILEEAREAKQARIEEQVKALQQFAEQASMDQDKSMTGRWMHRLVQNTSVEVTDITIHSRDTKRCFSGGVLLRGLALRSLGPAENDQKYSTLHKLCKIEDLAAYVAVEKAKPCYLLQPTRMQLKIEHRASNLKVRLELLGQSDIDAWQAAEAQQLAVAGYASEGSTAGIFGGVDLVASRVVLAHMLAALQEMSAWTSHVEAIVARYCKDVPTDEDALKGQTYEDYVRLYRRRCLNDGEDLSITETSKLETIEVAVKARLVARWRMEVRGQLKQADQAATSESRFGWWRGRRDDASKALLGEDEWRDIQRQVHAEQAHLEDVGVPSSFDVSFLIGRISLRLYDDGNVATSLIQANVSAMALREFAESDIVQDGDSSVAGTATRERLAQELDEVEAGRSSGNVVHDMVLQAEHLEAVALLNPRVIRDKERFEWSFDTRVGKIELCCDGDMVLSYASTESEKLISLQNSIGADIAERITVAVHMPAPKLRVSPTIVSVAVGLVSLDLPEPPTFEFYDCTPAEEDCYDYYHYGHTAAFAQRDDWRDDFMQWRQQQAELVREQAVTQAARAQQSDLVLDVDVAISAPQLTVIANNFSRIHLNLGRITLKSEDVMTARKFGLKLELSDTQVYCTTVTEESLPVLEPISLLITLQGKEPSVRTVRRVTAVAYVTGSGSTEDKGEQENEELPPIDLEVSVVLRELRSTIHPKAAQMFCKLPDEFQAALGGAGSRRPSVVNPETKPERRPTTEMSAAASGNSRTVATTDATAGENLQAADASTEATKYFSNVTVSAQCELLNITLLDTGAAEVARVDAVKLRSDVSLVMDGQMSCNTSLERFMIVLAGTPFVQMTEQSDQMTSPGQAVSCVVDKGEDQRMLVNLRVCPVVVMWRKRSVMAFVSSAAACVPSMDPAEINLEEISDAIEQSVTSTLKRRKSDTETGTFGVPDHLDNVEKVDQQASPEANDASRELARQGLSADCDLPPLKSSLDEESSTMVVAAEFGGLIIEIHCDAEEQEAMNPAWRGATDAALVRLEIVNLSVKKTVFATEEDRMLISLGSLGVLYDGQAIIAPWTKTSSIFEGECRTYIAPSKGGPFHSVCFRGKLRRVALVHFLKHLDGLMFLVHSSVVDALVRQAAENVVDVVQDSFSLWNIAVEAPVVHMARDEALLRHSPSWTSETEQILQATQPSGCFQYEAYGEEFEHPTPIVHGFRQFAVLNAGRLEVRNLFQPAKPNEAPPFMCSLAISQCSLELFDRVGPSSGSLLGVIDFQMHVRCDASTAIQAMHTSVGLHFGPAAIHATQAQLAMIISIINDNVNYRTYFPEEIMEAPEGLLATKARPAFAKVAAAETSGRSRGPTFASRLSLGPRASTIQEHSEDEEDVETASGSTSEEESETDGGEADDEHVESMSVNVRLEFEELSITASCAPPASSPAYPAKVAGTPFLRVAASCARIGFDGVMYYGGKGMLFEFGLFINSLTADDLRPAGFRASAPQRRFLDFPASSSRFAAPGVEDPWTLVPDRVQGDRPMVPDCCDLLFMVTKSSDNTMVMRFELDQPELFALTSLLADAGAICGDGFMQSSMNHYEGPPLTVADEDAAPDAAAVALPPTTFQIVLRVRKAKVACYTQYEKVGAPLIELSLGALNAQLSTCGEDVEVQDISLSQLSVLRSDVNESASADEARKRMSPLSSGTVQLVSMSSLQVALTKSSGPRPALKAIIRVHPMSIRLTVSDGPHLLAALSGIGADGAGKAMHKELPFDPSNVLPKASQATASGQESSRQELQRQPGDATKAHGRLRLRVIGVYRGESGVSKLDGQELSVTAEIGGRGEPVTAKFGQPLLLHVPAVYSHYDSDRTVGEGPILKLSLLKASAANEQPTCVGTLSFPVELAAGHGGLSCRRYLRPACNSQSGFPSAEFFSSWEIEFAAHYESQNLSKLAIGLTDMYGPDQSIDDFLAPVTGLEDFLGEKVRSPSVQAVRPEKRMERQRSVRRKKVTILTPNGDADGDLARSSVRYTSKGSVVGIGVGGSTVDSATSSLVATTASEALSEQPEPAQLAARIFVSIEGLEAAFLDDCRAKVLPVLRLHVQAKSKLSGLPTAPLLNQIGAEGSGGLILSVNPWTADSRQRLGLSVRLEECMIGVEYLNAQVGHWEPFLERWTFDAFFDAFEEAGEQQANHRPDHTTLLSVSDKYPSASEFTLVSFSPLRLNVTPQLCNLAGWLLSHQAEYSAAFTGEQSANAFTLFADDTVGCSKYRVLNLSGVRMQLAVVRPSLVASSDKAGDRSRKRSGSDQASSDSKKHSHGDLRWHIVEPSESEVSLDSLLGHRSAEEWRQLADEVVVCYIRYVDVELEDRQEETHVSGSSTRSEAASPTTTSVLLSSTSDNVLHVRGPFGDAHVMCQVLAPHPSHKLLLLSSGLRVFNHTGRGLSLTFAGSPTSDSPQAGDSQHTPLIQAMGSGRRPPSAARMDLLPKKQTRPPNIGGAMHGEEDLEALPQTAPEDLKKQYKVSAQDEADGVHYIPPEHFCVAPPGIASIADALKVRLPGAQEWSEIVACGSPPQEGAELEEEGPGTAILVPCQEGVPLRFHVHRRFSPMSSSLDHALTSVHISCPLKIMNATPACLSVHFSLPSSRPNEYSYVIDVNPFSVCELPPTLDPLQAYGLCWAFAADATTKPVEAKVSGEAQRWQTSTVVPKVFDTSSERKDLAIASHGTASGDPMDRPLLGFEVTRGLACRIACSRWLVDRTKLGLRVIHSARMPTQDCAMLPRVGDHMILLNPARFRAPANGKRKSPELKYYLASMSSDDCWDAICQVELPEANGAFTYASIMDSRAITAIDMSLLHSAAKEGVHVCLSVEAVSTDLTLGAPCQLISILPQVVIYNEVADDALLVRALDDASSEIKVESMASSQFLRWSSRTSTSCTRARCVLQFRPSGLQSDLLWSPAIATTSEATGSISVALGSARATKQVPDALRMFSVDVTERAGVVCVTISRGSRCEVQNFSRLVETVSAVPVASHTGSSAQGEECTVARSCETCEFAWRSSAPTGGDKWPVQLELRWNSMAGGGQSVCVVPDLQRIGKTVVRAPSRWHAVVVETGGTDKTLWIRVHDLVWTSAFDEPQNDPKAAGHSFAPVARFKIGLSLATVGVSLMSERHERELTYAELGQIGMLAGVWEDCRKLELVCTDFQWDCQLINYRDVPVIAANHGESGLPCFRCQVLQELPTTACSLSLQRLSLQVDALQLSLTEEFINATVMALLDLLQPIMTSSGITKKQLEAWRVNPLDGDFSTPPPVPLQVNIDRFTFHGLEATLWASMKLDFLSAALRRAIGFVTHSGDEVAVRGAVLRLRPDVFDGIRGALPAVVMTLLRHYWINFIMSVASILGQSTLLTLPALPIGWMRGSVGASMKAASLLFSKAQDVLEIATLDQHYIKRKRRERQMQDEREVAGIRAGLNELARDVAQGVWCIGDVVWQPIHGARQDGVKGFLAGFGRGLVGSVVKPVVEIASGGRNFAQVVSRRAFRANNTPERRVITRRRPPRVMYGSGSIREYDEAAALLTLEVATAPPRTTCSTKDRAAIEQARFGITEHIVVSRTGASPYLSHLLLLLTPVQLLLVDLDASGIAVRWALPMAAFRGVYASSHGVVVRAEEQLMSSSSSAASGGASAALWGKATGTTSKLYQIPCEDARVIQAICKMLRPLQAHEWYLDSCGGSI